jgi:hypothetical protein
MIRSRTIARGTPIAALAMLAACAGTTEPAVPAPDAGIRVVNASGAAIDVSIDGRTATQGLAASNVSTAFGLTSGTHQVSITSGGKTVPITVQTIAGQVLTTVAFTNAGSTLQASVLADTGSIVPAGKSKLRVSNFSTSAIEIWRTQPDFQSPVHIMTPFVWGATSPYLQSDPGSWEVFVTPPGGGAKLATTGAVSVPAGERRTIVLVDSAGAVRTRVIAE